MTQVHKFYIRLMDGVGIKPFKLWPSCYCPKCGNVVYKFEFKNKIAICDRCGEELEDCEGETE